ncbi:MAG: hypothetical protein QW112_01930 [Candidatus Micrarchaeia archaeon]
MKVFKCSLSTEGRCTLNIKSYYKCKRAGCMHEEIVETTTWDYDPDWPRRGATVIKNCWEAFYAAADARREREEALFRRLKEREAEIKAAIDAVIERQNQRRKRGFWKRLFAKD